MTTSGEANEAIAQGAGSPPSGIPPNAAAGKGNRRLRNYLLDGMQLRYTAVMVFASGLLMAVLSFFVYRYAHEATETVRVQIIGTYDDPAMQAQVLMPILEGDRRLVLALVGTGIAVCLILTVFGIVLTHKVAGPMYKISTYFAQVRDGRIGPVYELRKGDELHDFFESFKAMHEALRTRTKEEIEVLARVIAAMEVGGVQGEAAAQLDALKTLKRKKEESLA